MGRRIGILIIGILMLTACTVCSNNTEKVSGIEDTETKTDKSDLNIAYGTTKYRGFIEDNVLHSETFGDIHFNLYIPETYDGNEPYALYFTLPGYQGLYFQGIGQNIKMEEFGFEAQKYNNKMIIVAPQLEDWGETSANQTVELVEYFISHYNIDTNKVYGSGYSGGGETMSLVMGLRPDLFAAYLHCSAKWDGDIGVIVKSQTPVYMVIGENDEYYGSQTLKDTYQKIYDKYVEDGLSEQEIGRLLTLDVKGTDYFVEKGITNQHGGGGMLFALDKNIMGWIFDN